MASECSHRLQKNDRRSSQFAPQAVEGKDGKVTAFVTKGRDGESSMTLKADMVVFAIGQAIEDEYSDFKAADGVFIGGDMKASRGATVVQAVADGKEAALAIENYLV